MIHPSAPSSTPNHYNSRLFLRSLCFSVLRDLELSAIRPPSDSLPASLLPCLLASSSLDSPTRSSKSILLPHKPSSKLPFSFQHRTGSIKPRPRRRRFAGIPFERGNIMPAKHVLIATYVSLLGATSVFAQSVPPPPALPTPSPQSAVHVTTRIVQVSVTVHDDRGRPITGLTKDDFVLLDQGQRQQITSITEQANRLTTTAATSAPNLFTNRFEQGAAQPLLSVIVIDAYNARFWDQFPKSCGGKCPPLCVVGYMFQQVEKFISKMQPQDRVALYVLGADDLYLLQDFTSDPTALQRALVRGKEHVPVTFPPSQIEPREMDAHTMDAMRVISDRLAKLPGRKSLIWLSTGFPPDAGLGKTALNSVEKMDKTAKTLGDADFPLFAIDVTGLTAGGGVSGGGSGGGGGRGASSGVGGPTPSSFGTMGHDCTIVGRLPQLSDFDYSKDLAEQSGGRAYYNTNDFAGAIRKVIDESASTYILGYYPDHNKWNGEFREIKVKVNRPGLEVRARKGYYAVADTTSVQERDAQKLVNAVRSPLESTDLGFDVQADGFDDYF